MKNSKLKRRDSKLAHLVPEMQDAIEEIVDTYGLTMAAEQLRKKFEAGGKEIWVSTSTLSRFLRERAEERLRENQEAVSETVGRMSKVDRKEFRAGTLSMLQQRIYEDAVATKSTEKIKGAYEMLVAQEQKEAELELAARYAAVAEENAKAARRKVELAAASSALALLPKLQEILLKEGVADGEILREARKCLLAGGGELMRAAEAPALAEISASP